MLGDDVPEGKVTSFPMAVKRKDETVVFSWITWPRSTKAVRDDGMKKFIVHGSEMKDMPFDGHRGFQAILQKK